MKKINLLSVLTIWAVLVACSSKSNDSKVPNEDTRGNLDGGGEPTSSLMLSKDSLSYIGYIEKFADNGLFYTDLYFKEDFNYDGYDKVANTGDSTVYKDEETNRRRIPLEKAAEYFDLTGLSEIKIYNRQNELLTTGKFIHVEYLEDALESRFVAVFDVENHNLTEYEFCIGNSNANLARLAYSAIEDPKLKSAVLEYLKLDATVNSIGNVSHYKLNQSGIIYSSISADTTAFIIESANDKFTTIYKSNSSEAISGMVIVSKQVNGRPILITKCLLPESDAMWTSLLIFDGAEYRVSKNHRINGM
jgi:hypothetical protein